ncbi:oxidase [Pseudomonas parafulva]|uniref:oxidase n=1 Tax=Pseudomonas parafulva TaxID=157782 RepID=UPI00041654EE|nr:oxidase [Pseudomonas parafulva]
MSILCVFDPSSPALPNKVLTHREDIEAALAEHGVSLIHAEHGLWIRPGTAEADVLVACGDHLDRLMTTHASPVYRLVNRDGEQVDALALREEHTHDGQEVFAVISGRAQLGLRLGGWVYSVVCEKGDQLTIPANTRRWVELGETPFCLAFRLYASEQSANPLYTGDDAARAFLGIDEL